MSLATLAELREIAEESFDKAKLAARRIGITANFSESIKEGAAHYAKSLGFLDTASEEDIPPFMGFQAYCSILSFDLRGSSNRAIRIGPRSTFITMHTYMNTMLALVKRADGMIVGLRGDGAIAAFELQKMQDSFTQVDQDVIVDSVRTACKCGDAMINTLKKVVNPVLANGDIQANLKMGVGIDIGHIVATNIGFGNAREITGYGKCINTACKISDGVNEVYLTEQAHLAFPKKPGGPTRFRPIRHRVMSKVVVLQYPATYQSIG